MALLVTEVVVLHAMDYLESSRILRVATREAGVQSVLAKGARRPKSRFGAALDLFAQGTAQILVKPGRDLQTLAGFDVARSRSALAEELGRFMGASAIAELMLRFGHEDTHPELFDSLVAALDDLATAPATQSREVAIAAAWRLIGVMGFAPSLSVCSICHGAVAREEVVRFHHRAGGVLCSRCAATHPGGRPIPLAALDTLRVWLDGAGPSSLPRRDARAHQRLLREFLREHLGDGRPLRAFEAWERGIERTADERAADERVAEPADAPMAADADLHRTR
jgi:DNA repair protein RecO (recombination protein O)